MPTRKILIIDDSETVLEATQVALEEHGYEVVALDSAALFAATLNRAKPDLALVDVSMPVVKGQLLVSLARRHQLHPCVIALHSSLPEETLRALAAECGADGFVQKTADPDVLAHHVERLLARAPRNRPKPTDAAGDAPRRAGGDR